MCVSVCNVFACVVCVCMYVRMYVCLCAYIYIYHIIYIYFFFLFVQRNYMLCSPSLSIESERLFFFIFFFKGLRI